MTPSTDPGKVYLMVFGTRTFDQYDLLQSKLDRYVVHLAPVTVVTGEWRGVGYGTPGYIGADLLAEKWASTRRFSCLRFPPRFEDFPGTKLGRTAALHARNREMVEFVAAQRDGFAHGFWDGVSSGTASVIELLKKHRVTYHVTRYKEDA